MSDLINAMVEMREEDAIAIVKSRLSNGDNVLDLLAECRTAMDIVGKKFAEGEYFIPELMMAGEILSQISDLTKSNVSEASSAVKKNGRFLLGTVQGDIHDIGKNIVGFMLDVNGFEVIDLGVDVSKEKFVEAVKEHNPDIVGLSGILTLAYDPMKETIAAIKAAGLRDKVKIIIGGGAIDEQVRQYTEADAFASDAMRGVNISKEWMGLA